MNLKELHDIGTIPDEEVGGFYAAHKDEYENLLIDYPASPSGRAYIGIAKRPLMPTDTGIGFRGVILQNDDRTLIQCYGCGKWAKKLVSRHIMECTGLTDKEYKDRFGLNWGKGLVSDELSMRLTKNALKGQANVRNRWTHETRPMMHQRKKLSTAFQNRYGTCPLQLKVRLLEFVLANQELPAQGNRGRSIYKALRNRFGTVGEGFAHYGLPLLRRVGSNMEYLFPDNTSYRYNINQPHDRVALYQMMMQKCPVLSEPLPE